MKNLVHHHSCVLSGAAGRSRFAIILSLALLMAAPLCGQTFQVIHDFTGTGDGSNPRSGFSMDGAGNLYGTTFWGGAGFGTVFKLKHAGSGWTLVPLYTFRGGNDGANPWGRVVIGPDGTLYGTTANGGGNGCGGLGCGTVFRLGPQPTRPSSVLSPWMETVLYRFTGGSDGAYPSGELTFDPQGNIYGTTQQGSDHGVGVIYKLSPGGGGWTQTVIYTAQNNGDGADPMGGVVLDANGNVYGVFTSGGLFGGGAVYELSPSLSGWTEQNLHNFMPAFENFPYGGLIIDATGTLYGSTEVSDGSGGGYAFALSNAGGLWSYTLLPYLSGVAGPQDRLFLSAAGDLYGTSVQGGGAIAGSVFKLVPSGGGWTYTSLHDFCLSRPCSDGQNPISNIVIDPNGNLFGTTSLGGSSSGCSGGCGVAFEITP